MCCEQVYMYTCIVIYGTTTYERWRPAEHRQTDCVSNVHKYKSHLTWKKKVKTFVLSFFLTLKIIFLYTVCLHTHHMSRSITLNQQASCGSICLSVCIWSITERLRFLLYIPLKLFINKCMFILILIELNYQYFLVLLRLLFKF